MTDLEQLRRLPRLLVESGYVDALQVHGLFTLGDAVRADLELLAPPTATLVRLFALHEPVPRARLDEVAGADLVAALLRLGVLVEGAGGAVSSGQLVAMPLLGQVALLPSPAEAPTAYFGDDTAALVARILPTRESTLVVGAGPGLPALRAAATAQKVVAVEHDPVALGCAELNLEMNGLRDRVTLVSGFFDEALDEPPAAGRYARVLALLPPSPLPVRGGRSDAPPDGPELMRRMLAALPRVLDGDGVAQLVGAFYGDDAGPSFGFDLATFAAESGLRLVVTLPSRQPVEPGSPIFESVATRLTRLAGGDERVVRRGLAEHLAKRRASWLYLALVSAARSDGGAAAVTRHFLRPGGSYSR